MRNKLSIIITAIVLIGVGLAGAVKAITLIPPSLEFGLIPGQTQKTEIKLFNETTAEINLYTKVVNFVAKDDTGEPDFLFEGPFDEGLSAWVDVQPGPIALEPGQRVSVPITVNPPLDAEAGGHYAAVFFTENPPEASGPGVIRVASSIGTLLLTQVEGEIVKQGSLAGFTTASGQKFLNRLPIDFIVRFQNDGNVHLRPTGTITITSTFGNTAATLEVNPSKGAALPEQIRKFEAVWEKGQVKETTGNAWTSFWKELGNEWRNFAFGRYKANLNLTFGSASDQQTTATTCFWVFPWRVILIGAIVLLVVILLLILLIKRYNRWIVKEAQKRK
ncbi:MAG: hypothetical protein COT24_01390 [Candidatus Kerfeldbacteria bacterium CG08_land_8_20_14_0_20_40_16]|uniref:DUF916 domain-containing protein n=1 Tax=Candidatus Kerfeldbacteria bacterium CG08_land_8_20_14_0_20_40_16 TaxID=2014244 RepID=A0A2H0YWI3_9BACT|nr:MAG: hypothetical protein COT24_01390 [Candidatus Kerfeldbacteria bacterium CG08_land_8_20_14_0_20_40_16]